jgi:hypothetical protein
MHRRGARRHVVDAGGGADPVPHCSMIGSFDM